MRVLSRIAVLPGLRRLAPPAASGRAKARWAVKIVLLALTLALAAETIRVLFGGNLHTVIPGRVYRSAQLSTSGLKDAVNTHGVRTIVNLRGRNPWMEWYREECDVAHALNVSMEDVTFSANRLPARSELRQLIDVFDHSEHPLLIHCRQGADRTGLASAAYLMLQTDTDYQTARQQCGPRYAHLPVLSTAQMDRFFEMYEQWLAAKSEPHSRANFRTWALDHYRPDPAPARLELLDPLPTLAVGQPMTLRVQATNLSNEAWRFAKGRTAGVCLRYHIIKADQPVLTEHGGLMEKTVAPGETVEIAMPLRGFQVPGKYRVQADLFRHPVSFSQLGSEPLMFELTVRSPDER
jgi:protein tyrosine phosphatase (PTP) superfamily phosphohydrolase (DUF442 family)